jgi:hypothetical protein
MLAIGDTETTRKTNIAGGEMKIVAIVLIVIGAISLAYGGITYTTREKVLDLGPIEATAEREKTVPLPPIIGGVALVAGIGLLVMSSKKS